MKNGKRRIYIFISCAVFIMLLFLPGSRSYAEEKERIKVGYFKMSGYHETLADGKRRGFGYDYLQEIAKYTGWEYEFVEGSWEECLDKLDRGEIDLVTCVKHSAEREEKFAYSQNHMGVLYSLITVRADNDSYCYNDFASFGGMKVGMIKGNQANQELAELCTDNRISIDEFYFDKEEEMKEALDDGSIDAVISSNQRVLSNEKIIGRFGPGAFYAVTWRGNTELMKELDDAMDSIVMSNPYFEAQLYEKYFSDITGYRVELTREEKEYVREHNTIRMATCPNMVPMSYFDGEKYTGIINDSMEALADEVGLNVEYVLTDTYKESMELLREGRVDILADTYSDYSWGEENGVVLTEPYLYTQYVEVRLKSQTIHDESSARIAACEDYYFNKTYILKHYAEKNITYYKSERDCVDAVRKGKADIAFVNQYTAQILLGEDENLKLSRNALYETHHGLSAAVPRENTILCHILNKAIHDLDATDIDQIVEQHTYRRNTSVSLMSYIYYNPLEFIVILCFVFCAVVLVLLYFIMVKRRYSRHIFELAYRDKLTGLDNIYRFEELAEKRWLEFRGRDIFILSLDISHFTTINEIYGRSVGDMVIGYVGTKLNELYGQRAIIARSKVDNFLICGIYLQKEEITALLERISEKIRLYKYEENNIYLSYNYGIVTHRCTGSTSIKRLIDQAEMARKAAKGESRHIRYFNEAMEQQLLREKAIEDSMKSALEEGEFLVYYQPKYCMTDNRIIGAEALVRWKSREYGFMNPGEFIPIFENNGFVVELDFYVMEQVYRMLRERIDAGKENVRVSINQSRMHFMQVDYLERLNALRNKYRIPEGLIELELTESIFAQMKDISAIVRKLKDNGYHLSVDDFGAGYSSLNMLKEIPLDTLKIDKDFLNNTDEDGRYRKVIGKVVELARDLDMDIICEGVEKKEQAEFLKSVGCIYAQGFLYARPMPEEEFTKLLS